PAKQKPRRDDEKRNAGEVEQLDLDLTAEECEHQSNDQGHRAAAEQAPPEAPDGAEHSEREAVEEYDRVAAEQLPHTEPRCSEDIEEHRGHACVTALALVEVADGGHDVETADAVRGNADHC